jgi:hypothetical protein
MTDPTYHVLLIGVDAYPIKPLSGCVNDIDAVQRLLLGDRVGIPAASIQRLASPHPGTKHETTVPSDPATLDNLRRALGRLALEVPRGEGDHHVFIYYSGHGTRVPVGAPPTPSTARRWCPSTSTPRRGRGSSSSTSS